jgi:hypothetical protein
VQRRHKLDKISQRFTHRIGLILFIGLFVAVGTDVTVNVFAASAPAKVTSLATGRPDTTNTGTAGCPALTQVVNPAQIVLDKPGTVYENKELMNPGVLAVRAKDITIRCVKMHGTGYFGIDNSGQTWTGTSSADLTLDQVDITCQNAGQANGLQLQHATVTRANVHNCAHFLNVGGDYVTVKDSYCHDLTARIGVHASCVELSGGGTNLTLDHNDFWGRDTADVLLGQEYGEYKNVVINNNRFMSVGTPAPAYLLYLSGTNTSVTNNRFSVRYSLGPCTLTTSNPYTWKNNVWDNTGKAIPGC